VRPAAGGQDAIDLLTRDHDKVADLFRRFESASDREKERIFGQINDELTVHAEIEEQIFYPAVERMRSEDSGEMVKEAHQEHDKVKELLEEISAKVGEAEDFDAKVTELKENVEHHVGEEEGEMFPEVRQVLGAARLRELGAEMRELKQQLGAGPGQARRPAASGRRRSPEAAT
jgi:iron-sulfur cluster repair protein YtfE (RIC family)